MIRFALVLPLILAACPKDETISGYADKNMVFSLVELDGKPFGAEATIAFPEEGNVRGNGPCNSYAAEQTAPYPWFQMSAVRATRRACADLPLETEFFEALQQMSLIEVQGGTLILKNDAGREMVFQATHP